MKFKISKEVCEKYSDLIVYLPIIKGFDNSIGEKESIELLRTCETILRNRYKSVEALMEDPYMAKYFETFKAFGANPLKIMPTHFALAKRVLEGKELPNINPIVNIYNALSIKYNTPFGGEDLDTVYGDFELSIASGDEHWKGISEQMGKNPPKGSLIWKDDLDVSTVALNWRQCERTKLSETSANGYFVMDGFKNLNDVNIRTAAEEFVGLVTKICGGQGSVLYLDAQKPSVEIDFESLDVSGVEIPEVIKTEKVLEKQAQDRQKTVYVYIDGSAQKTIQLVLSEALELNPEEIQVSQTQDSKYGDYTSPVAMRLSKERRQNPIQIANEIAIKIGNNEIFNKCEAVAPGYINFFLSDSYLKNLLVKIDENFGVSKEMSGKKIMVEYGQPNTHKAVTVGHVKSAISGMSVARLYENLGYEVVHANYFGDLGPYVAKSIYSLLNKVGKVESVSNITDEIIDKAIELIEGIKKEGGYSALKEYFGNLYIEASKIYESDEEVTGVVKEINALLFNKENELINKIYKYTRAICIEYLNDFFGSLGVRYDRQYPESEAWEKGKEIVVENIGKVFKEDQGAIIFDGKEFKLSNWVFLTSQGTPTYSGKELGLIDLKFKEYPDLDFALVLTSVEQNEYFKGVIKAWELINPQLVGKYRHIGFGWLLMNNKKTSSRGGTVSFDEMIAESKDLAKEKISELKEYSESEIESISNSIATSGFKFNILSHEFHKDINYDPKSFLSLSGYSAPYIIYSYTRAMSILTKVGEIKTSDLVNVLKSSEELGLMRKLNEYPELVRNSGLNLSPHLLCEYLYKLANTFNAFYTTNRIVDETDEIKYSRALLISKTALVLKRGLYLLGIDVIEKM